MIRYLKFVGYENSVVANVCTEPMFQLPRVTFLKTSLQSIDSTEKSTAIVCFSPVFVCLFMCVWRGVNLCACLSVRGTRTSCF